MRRLTLSLLILVLVAILQVSFVRAQAPTAASERKSFDEGLSEAGHERGRAMLAWDDGASSAPFDAPDELVDDRFERHGLEDAGEVVDELAGRRG